MTTPGSLLLTTGFGLAPNDRCLMGPIKVIPVLGSSSLLLLLEEKDSLDSEEFSSCGEMDELPKWLLFSSLIETEDDEILLHDDGRATSLTLKVGNFFCTWEVTTLDGWGRNHYVWYR